MNVEYNEWDQEYLPTQVIEDNQQNANYIFQDEEQNIYKNPNIIIERYGKKNPLRLKMILWIIFGLLIAFVVIVLIVLVILVVIQLFFVKPSTVSSLNLAPHLLQYPNAPPKKKKVKFNEEQNKIIVFSKDAPIIEKPENKNQLQQMEAELQGTENQQQQVEQEIKPTKKEETVVYDNFSFVENDMSRNKTEQQVEISPQYKSMVQTLPGLRINSAPKKKKRQRAF